MKIKIFEGVNKEELSMIEVAYAILAQRKDVMDFSDLVNEIQTYLEKSDSEIRSSLAQFYTDLNIDGSFISLGDNRWGLRSWYPIDSIDEEVSQGVDDEEEVPRRKKRKKVNAFIIDEDGIDYSDDDPEDAEIVAEEDEVFVEEDEEDEDEDEEIKAYDSDLKEIGADKDDEDEDIPSIEEDLTIIEDSDFDQDEDEENEDQEDYPAE